MFKARRRKRVFSSTPICHTWKSFHSQLPKPRSYGAGRVSVPALFINFLSCVYNSEREKLFWKNVNIKNALTSRDGSCDCFGCAAWSWLWCHGIGIFRFLSNWSEIFPTFFLFYNLSVYHMMMTAPLTHTCTDFVIVVRRFSIAKKLD